MVGKRVRNRAGRGRALPFVVLGLLLIVILVAYALVVRLTLPSWQERAQFGEAFGALNALFSGAALIGVAYALWLQQRQLGEMRRSIVLQQQPLLSVKASSFSIDSPKLFRAPDRPIAEVHSRYHVAIQLTNISQYPAVGALLRATLRVPTDSGPVVMRPIESHVPLLAPEEEVPQAIMFVPSEPYDTLYRSLRTRDAFALPEVTVEVAYRNLVGAGFLLRQAYSVIPTESIDSDLKAWHAAIASFGAEHQRELSRLAEEGYPDELFEALQEELAASLDEREDVELAIVSLPGRFLARNLTSDEYAGIVDSAGVSHFTFSDTKCSLGVTSQEGG